jgi:hypothetical protein
VKVFDVGTEPVGFIAIGQNATGVIAIGQLATGVIAIGQFARGVFVIGQLAVGLLAFGQLCIALTYGGGMVGVAGFCTGPSLLVWGVIGEGHLRREGRWRLSASWQRTSGPVTMMRMAALLGVAVAVVLIGLSWLPDYPDKLDGPPPTTLPPGSR